MCLHATLRQYIHQDWALLYGEDASNFFTLQHLHVFRILPNFGTRKLHDHESLSTFRYSYRSFMDSMMFLSDELY